MFSVVIPSRNLDNLLQCIGAIRAAGETCRVVVIDGGLEQRAASWTCRIWPEFGAMLVIPGQEPFIFARACNQGIMAAPNDDIVLLNDDALLMTRYGFTQMVESHYCTADTREPVRISLLACATNVTGYPAQQRRACPHDRQVRELPLIPGDRYSGLVNFCAVLIPRSTLTTVGLLDERFGGPGVYGGEDVDYCLRVRQAGLKIGVTDFCSVDHSKLPSTFRAAHPGNAAAGDISESNRIGIEKWGEKWPLR